MNKTELKKKLDEGLVTFTYIKKDGSERLAHGTTNIDVIRKLCGDDEAENFQLWCDETTHSLKDTVPELTLYFDTDKFGLRNAYTKTVKVDFVQPAADVE